MLILTIAIFQLEDWSTITELSRVLFILMSFSFPELSKTYIASKLYSEPANGIGNMMSNNYLIGY